MPETWRLDLPRIVVTAALYAGLGFVGAQLLGSLPNPSPVYLPAGVAIGATMRWGYRVWPGVMLGVLVFVLGYGSTVSIALALSATCSLIATAAPWLLHRILGFRFRLDNYQDALTLLVGAMLAGGMSAAINPLLLTVAGVPHMTWHNIAENVGVWWLGDALGVLLVTPLFLVWRSSAGQPLFPKPRNELFLALGALTLILGVIFGGWMGGDFQNLVFILAPFPVLIWIGIRLQRPAATIASLIVAVMSLHGTANGHGPFVEAGNAHNLIPLAAFLAASTLTLLLLNLALSERRRVEARLQRQSNLLENILNHLPGAVYWKDQQGVYIGCNAQFAQLVGMDDSHGLIGKSSHDLPKSHLLKTIDGRLDEEIIRTGQPRLEVEVQVELPDGQCRTLLTNKLPLRDAQRAVIGMIGTVVDVTALKQADQMLHDNLNRLRHIVDRLPAGAVYIEGELLHFNSQAEVITGYKNKEIPTREVWFQKLYPADPEGARRRYEANRALGFPRAREVQITHRSGELRWVEIPCYRDDEGEIWVLHDTTERHKIEETLRDREVELAHITRLSTLGEMVAEIAHEINQPLYAIANFSTACLTTLETRPPEAESQLKEWLEKIHGQSQQAATIIRRLRHLAAPSAPQSIPLDLEKLLSDVLEMLAADARKRGVQTQTEFPKEIPLALGDPVQSQQVLINLIKNAYEALEEVEPPRTLAIRLLPQEKMIELIIADNGPGFTRESKERMFDAFYTTKSRGMGMGLPICRSLITAQGGKLWVESVTPHGAELHFTLPRADAADF